jgi:hypothetical protein
MILWWGSFGIALFDAGGVETDAMKATGITNGY